MQNVWVLAKSSTHPWRKVFLFQFMQVGILIKLKKQEQIGDSIINLSSLVGVTHTIYGYMCQYSTSLPVNEFLIAY